MYPTPSASDDDVRSRGRDTDDMRLALPLHEDADIATDFSSIFKSDTVEILVGPDKQVFYVHKQLLREKVPYFEVCLKEDWKKDKDDAVDLREVDPAGFGFIVTWLYTERLPERIQGPGKGTFDWDMMDVVYKVADGLMITQLQNDLVNIHLDSLAARGSQHWFFGKLARLYRLDLSHTPYYQMVLKSLARAIAKGVITGLTGKVNGLGEDTPSAVMRELLLHIESYHEKSWPAVTAPETDRCEFHIHDGEGKCAKKMKHS